jgi:hypothetical protein
MGEKRDRVINVSGISGDISGSIVNIYHPVRRKGNTTFLTIQRFNENFSVTAANFTDEHPFSPVFPTAFITVDEDCVKRVLIERLEKG